MNFHLINFQTGSFGRISINMIETDHEKHTLSSIDFLNSDPINRAVIYLPPVRWTPKASYNVPVSKGELIYSLENILAVLDIQIYSVENKQMAWNQFLKFHPNFAKMARTVKRDRFKIYENWLKEKKELLEGEWTAICVERRNRIISSPLQNQLSDIKGNSPPNVYGVVHPEKLSEYPMLPWEDKSIVPLRFVFGDRTQSNQDNMLISRYYAIHIARNHTEAIKSVKTWQKI